MKLIKADHERRLEIPGVPGPAKRPVDIDKSKTGFANLRSLRIYRFDAGSTIDGHAEEDEVFVVVMAGLVEIEVTGDGSGDESRRFTLSAPNDSDSDGCVAYLPPHSAYQLVNKTHADIAYARATPTGGPPSLAFAPRARVEASGINVLIEEKTYAQLLRLRLVEIDAIQNDVAFRPIDESDAKCEALVHVVTKPAERVATITGGNGGPILLDSWDTASVDPGEQATLLMAKGSSALVLIVLAV